jgi:hypothetical protein
MMAASSSKCLVLSLIALAGLGAQDPRPAVKFAGKSIPDPPRQQEPWTPPRTKLPQFLVAATSTLFDQGMADPRGCEYREVEIVDGRSYKIRAFVLPERPGEPSRFAVSWDGVIYPASSVGPAADLDADIRALAGSMNRDRDDAGARKAGRRDRAGGFVGVAWRGRMFGPGGPPDASVRSALKLCLVLRLGRADLAEELFAAATTWTPELRGRNLTDYHVSYLTLAREWAATMFVRLVDAHMQGDDAIALDAARRLSAFAKAAEARAMQLGFQREEVRFANDRVETSYFPSLRQLPELLADQERRAKEPARGPIPERGADPAARVAALIRELDQIGVRQMVHFGNSPNSSPLVQALVAEGDAAVEPLIAAIETDTRMTRTVTRGRGMSIDRRVSPVLEPELAALTAILKTAQFWPEQAYQVGNGTLSRKDLARSMRDFWRKNRGVSLTERWYRMLRDDSGGYDRWLEGAANIAQPTEQLGVAVQRVHTGAPELNAAPMRGEELRSRRDPSVSELLVRRTLEFARAPHERTTPDMHLLKACQLAFALDRWDRMAALPVIRELMTRARESVDRDRSEGYSQFDSLVEHIAQFTLIRARQGDLAALAEYADEIRKSDPEKDQPRSLDAFKPIWIYPDDPAIREAARWLFNDRASPWAAYLRKPGNNRMPYFNTNIYASPLLRSAGFRDAVLAAMAIKSELGTVRHRDQTGVEYEVRHGAGGRFGTEAAEEIKQGMERSFRVGDYIAWQIAEIEGSPRCEIYWTEEMRDGAVAACVAFLNRFADRFTAEAPPGETDPRFQKRMVHLAFPILDHPATKEDVRTGRAIFSLEGEGEIRRVELPSVPVKAKGIPPEEAPGGAAEEGWVWQAEEVRKGGQWERYYGFVGGHVIARVPAAEIELAAAEFADAWGKLSGGLDAWIGPAEPRRTTFAPGKSVPVIARIRNRRGVENAAPREFLRRGPEGRPALRRGIELAVTYFPPSPDRNGPQPNVPHEERHPKRTDRFDPRDEPRPLSAFEALDALRLDLTDWFDLTRPGSYRVRLRFSGDSGVGEGASNDWSFTVGEGGGPVP